MADARDRGLLEALAEFLEKNGCRGRVSDLEDTPVLMMEYDDEDMPEYFIVSVEHIFNGTAQVSIVNNLFSGLDAEESEELIRLIPYMNRCLAFGYFGIDEAVGSFYFSSGLDITGLSGDSLAMCFMASFDLARRTSEKAMRLLLPFINGDESFSDADTEELSIVQF